MKQLLVIILLALTWPAVAFADKTAAEEIVVSNAFARASIPGRPMGAIFMSMNNTGDTEHLLVAVKGDMAKAIELHNHVKLDGMMRMRQMAHIHVKPGQTKALKPGGLHVMLIGLTRELVEGQSLSITLVFDDDSEKTLTVPIKAVSALQ